MSRPVTVLVLTPSIGGFYFGELLVGIGREITAAGGRLVLVQSDAGDDGRRGDSLASPVAWSAVDGAIAVTSAVSAQYLQDLRTAGKPVVLVSAEFPDFAAPTAAPDNRGGTRAAVQHLIAHGHRRIGFLGNLGQADVRDRYAAYQEALHSNGLPVDPALLFRVADNERDGGSAAAAEILRSAQPPTAVMVATDRNAIGLMRALRELGRVVPRDLAVFGFDNIESGTYCDPPLSSVEQRFDDVGALAGRLLLARLNGEDVAATQHVLSNARLELRGSCGCPPASSADRSERRAATDGADQRDALGAALEHIVRTGDAMTDAALSVAASTSADCVQRLLSEQTGAPAAAEVGALSAALSELSSDRPEVLRLLTREVLRHVGDAGGAPDALTAALWRLHAGALHHEGELTESALEEQFAVDAALLGIGGADPCRLDWLAGTHVRAGVLALWEETAHDGRLHVSGAYDADGLLPDLVGATVAAQHFPPPALIEAARVAERRACVVVPVASKGRAWGLLAVLGEVRATSTLEPYRHWASQLSAYLEQQTLQEAVRANEERYALASQATNDGLWEWNVRNGDVFMSERCCALLGLPMEPQADRLAAWESRLHPDDRAELRRCLGQVASGHAQTGTCHYRVSTLDGAYRWVLCKAIGVASPGGPVARVVGSMSDVHEQRCLEEQLRESALHDVLTGLPNRRMFLSQLDHAIELSRRSQTPYAVIFLDLDRFKPINDTHGHQTGDQVLIAIADRIRRELRATDIGARFGGDEFALLLHDVQPDAVVGVARRLQARLGQPIPVDGLTLSVGASLGIATSAAGYTDAEDVLSDADKAMYRAKEFRRGTITMFEVGMQARTATS